MSRSGRVELFFGDRKRFFALSIEGAEAIQEACDAGPEWIISRLQVDSRVRDIREPLRWGMIGAGESATDAAIALEKWAGPGNVAQWKPLAIQILGAFLHGAPDEDADDVGELRPPGAGKPRRSRAASSGSGSSTKSAAPSASRRTKSRPAASGG